MRGERRSVEDGKWGKRGVGKERVGLGKDRIIREELVGVRRLIDRMKVEGGGDKLCWAKEREGE